MLNCGICGAKLTDVDNRICPNCDKMCKNCGETIISHTELPIIKAHNNILLVDSMVLICPTAIFEEE